MDFPSSLGPLKEALRWREGSWNKYDYNGILNTFDDINTLLYPLEINSIFIMIDVKTEYLMKRFWLQFLPNKNIMVYKPLTPQKYPP